MIWFSHTKNFERENIAAVQRTSMKIFAFPLKPPRILDLLCVCAKILRQYIIIISEQQCAFMHIYLFTKYDATPPASVPG